jgi:signal peptidase
MVKNKDTNDKNNTDVAVKQNKTKKVFSVMGTIFTALILVLTLLVIVNAVVAKVQNKPVNIFGYSMAIVVTDSMQPEIMTGDLIIFKSCDIADVDVGDDVVFVAGNGFGSIAGQSVVHRVIEIGDGGLTTKGINNVAQDADKVTKDNLLGICIYNSSVLGGIVNFLIRFGILIVIALIALPFIVKQIIKIIKLVKEEKSAKEE